MDVCSCEVVSIREYISEVAETTEVIEGPLLSPVVDRFTSIYELRMKLTNRLEGGGSSWLAHQKCYRFCLLQLWSDTQNLRQRDLTTNRTRKTKELLSHSSDSSMRLCSFHALHKVKRLLPLSVNWKVANLSAYSLVRHSFSDHDVVQKEEETYQFEAKPRPISPPQYADTTESPLYWRTSTQPKGHDLRRPSSRKIKVYSKPVNFSNNWNESDCTDRKIVLEGRVSELEAQNQSLEKSVEVLKSKLEAAENEIQAAKLDLTEFVPRKLFLEQADELATEKERALQLKLKCGELESARLSLDKQLSMACAQFEAKRQCYKKRIQNLEEELGERIAGVSELKNPSPVLPSLTSVTPRTQNSQDQNSFHEKLEPRRVEMNMWSGKHLKGANMRDVPDQRQGYQQDMEMKLDGTEELLLKFPVDTNDGEEVPSEENESSAFRFPLNRVQYTNGDQENISHLDYANGNTNGEDELDGAEIKKVTWFTNVESQRKIIQLQTKIAQLGQRSDASAKTKLVQTDPCENGLNETQRTFELPHWEREFPLEDTETLSDYKPTGLPSTRICTPSSDGGDKLYELTNLVAICPPAEIRRWKWDSSTTMTSCASYQQNTLSLWRPLQQRTKTASGRAILHWHLTAILSSQYPLTRRPRPKTSLPPNYRGQPDVQLQAERNALVHFVADTIAAVVDANNDECSQIAKHLGLQPICTRLPTSILSVRDRNCHLRPGAQTSPFYLSFMRDIAWQNWTAVLAESLAGLSASCYMVLKKVELQTEELLRSSKHLADTRSLIAGQIQLMQDLQKQARKSRMNRMPQSKNVSSVCVVCIDDSLSHLNHCKNFSRKEIYLGCQFKGFSQAKEDFWIKIHKSVTQTHRKLTNRLFQRYELTNYMVIITCRLVTKVT
ncbi:hypothetical protein X801_01112, partial [Opisthorchis viverrini]